ncbi:MAG: hypothetical protein MUF23_15910 [Pirellula sp.]|jgi:hypothetical protein|nr:hypothetical protein [Pirellula sp.]
MRCVVMFLITFFAMNTFLFSQDIGNDASAANKSIGSGKVFHFRVTEFRLKKEQDLNTVPGQIVLSIDEMKANGDIEIIETMRLTVLDGHPSVMKQKKTAAVTTGTVNVPLGFPNRGGQPGDRPGSRSGPQGEAGGGIQQRSMSYVSLGSTVQLTAHDSNGQVLVMLSYNAARLHGDSSEDRMPDIKEFSIDTTLLLDPGKTTIVGGSNADSTSYLAISAN